MLKMRREYDDFCPTGILKVHHRWYFIGGVLSRVIVRGSVFPVFFQFGFEHINNETHEEKE